jgi:hypothetical protein
LGNRRAEREGKLDVHPWADDRPDAKQKRPGAIFRATWRDEFERFVTPRSTARACTSRLISIVSLQETR